MSDDKRPDWKKGFDKVKVIYKDTQISSLGGEFVTRAETGRQILVKNSKHTVAELKKVVPRMKMNHYATMIGIKSYLKHRFYIYPTLQKRIAMMGVLAVWLLVMTHKVKYSQFYRLGGFYILSNALVPDLEHHKKRLSIELNEQAKWISRFFK